MAPWFRSSTNRRAPPRIPSGDVGTIEPSLSAYLPPGDDMQKPTRLVEDASHNYYAEYAQQNNGSATPRTPALQIPVGDVGISDDCSTAIALEERAAFDHRGYGGRLQAPQSSNSAGHGMRALWSHSHDEGDTMLGPLPLPSPDDSADNSPTDSPRNSFEDISHESPPPPPPHIDANALALAPQYGRHTADMDRVRDYDKRQPMASRSRSADFPSPDHLSPRDTAGAGSQRRFKKKSVSFSSLNTLYDVTPYSEIYGDHPKNFNFDSEGNKVSSMSMSMQAQVLAFGVMSPMSQHQMVPHISPHMSSPHMSAFMGHTQDVYDMHESEPLF